jgi:hypothetical protein
LSGEALRNCHVRGRSLEFQAQAARSSSHEQLDPKVFGSNKNLCKFLPHCISEKQTQSFLILKRKSAGLKINIWVIVFPFVGFPSWFLIVGRATQNFFIPSRSIKESRG